MTTSPPIDRWVGPLVRSFLAGQHRDLLAPLVLQEPGTDGSTGADVPRRPKHTEPLDRSALASALRSYNEGVGHSRAEELSAQLADPSVEVVVTGQQAGLFGGPIYALSKAIAATLWARRLSESGRPALAVFWIASEDHDFEEVRSASFGGQAVSLAAAEDSTRPIGDRTINRQLLAAVEEAIKECGSQIKAPPFIEQALELGRSCYREGEPFSSGFARLLPRLLGDDCPLLLDSQEPALKAMQWRMAKRLVRRSVAAIAAIERREADIQAAGFKLQISSGRQTDGSYALPLFLHRDGCRFRVVLEPPGDDASPPAGYSLRGHEERGRLEQLVQFIESEPSNVSPSAVLRPVLQDACLGTTLQVLGPGELAYVPQAAPLYEVLEVSAPTVALRPQAVFLPPRLEHQFAQMVENTDLSASEILGPWSELEPILAGLADNGTLAGVDRLQALTQTELAGLAQPAKDLDPGLEAALAKTRDHLERGFSNFRARVERAGAQRANILNARVEKLRELALPGGTLQERTLCSLWLFAQFGLGATAQITQNLSLDPANLQVIPVGATNAPRDDL